MRELDSEKLIIIWVEKNLKWWNEKMKKWAMRILEKEKRKIRKAENWIMWKKGSEKIGKVFIIWENNMMCNRENKKEG